MSNQVGRAVVDRTGPTGNWDFEMTYAAPPPNGPLPPGVDLVIDSIEMASAD